MSQIIIFSKYIMNSHKLNDYICHVYRTYSKKYKNDPEKGEELLDKICGNTQPQMLHYTITILLKEYDRSVKYYDQLLKYKWMENPHIMNLEWFSEKHPEGTGFHMHINVVPSVATFNKNKVIRDLTRKFKKELRGTIDVKKHHSKLHLENIVKYIQGHKATKTEYCQMDEQRRIEYNLPTFFSNYIEHAQTLKNIPESPIS